MRQRLSVTVPEELLIKTKELALKEDRTLSAMVSALLRDALSRKHKRVENKQQTEIE